MLAGVSNRQKNHLLTLFNTLWYQKTIVCKNKVWYYTCHVTHCCLELGWRHTLPLFALFSAQQSRSGQLLWFCGKVLVVEGLQKWLPWEAARNFPHVWQSQCQSASKTDPQLAKAEPISNSGSASGLRRGKPTVQQQLRETSETIWEKQLCRHQGQWRRSRRRWSRHQSRHSPAARDEDHGEAGCLPAVHGGSQWNRDPSAAHGRPHARAGGRPKKTVMPWEACAAAGSCQDLRTGGERSPRCSRFAGSACDPMRDPRWSSLFLKDCTPWAGLTLE